MAGDTVKFRRKGEERRRQAFVEATLDCLAAHGYHGTTVRKIAALAGVAPGLLTHYFSGKEAVVGEAYRILAARLLRQCLDEAEQAGEAPIARLRGFVLACFQTPSLDPNLLRVWVNFWALTYTHDTIRAAHAETYGAYRRALTGLIADVLAAAGRPVAGPELARLAIGANAVLDGLWLEYCLDPSAFKTEDAGRIACHYVGSALGVDLSPAANPKS
ncbi:MAG: TetR family transcriptional regulator [Alphaproteobacteria bacterium]|nr:TetR family transcriptional regulator [Alphaproteobacteria bacterium]